LSMLAISADQLVSLGGVCAKSVPQLNSKTPVIRQILDITR